MIWTGLTWLFLVTTNSLWIGTSLVAGQQTTEVDVLILGGGLAGITAANHLHSNGIGNLLILEAQDYVGGRVKKIKIGNVTAGVGANWVHLVEEGDDNPILQIAKKLDLTGYLNNLFDFELKNSNKDSSTVNQTYHAFFDALRKVVRDNEDMPQAGDQPLRSALAFNGWVANTALKRTVEWHLLDFQYATKSDMISTRQFTEFSGTDTEDKLVTDPRGTAAIVDYLAQNLTGKIKTSKVVTEVKYGADGVEVKTNDGQTYKAKYALCTFSTGVLATDDLVKFSPELPVWKKVAISKIPLAYYTNIFVQFPKAFWENKEFLLNAGNIAATFPLLYNLNKKGIHPGSNTLLFTAIDDDSLRIETQPENDTIEEIMKTLQEMYPNRNISYPTEIVVGRLSQNPYIRGSYSNGVIGSTTADFHNLEGRVENLFFAGEACDEDYFGYMQGAYFSGLRQAKMIASCMNGKGCSAYKPQNYSRCPTTNAGFPEKNTAGLSLVVFSAMTTIWLAITNNI